ncbi:Retrovirus-related Pol polyprotein from transposon TNT 1-94 [Phytophthora fragariae]|uniref:Retrovirus-related Pol polyprotein from transposon TNT 1-94 n=1 Tax=Phytophthora fragariae TaxID=53985 RepID=A0A6A3V550_9STRA|nr:Retrovirus-related Pol polyprotein from transposon TNT 1-94 [Phytophthora fragariae]
MASDDAAQWREAMDAELLSHERNGTWTLVPRGTANRTIGCRWVFAKKRDQYGRVVRYKARLVAKGFKQKYGIDFFETYSPVANMNSIRVVLSVCAAYEYRMEQLDADTAFLNSELKDRVYMEVPFGIENARDYQYQLNKAIYGLMQAASAWNKTIHRVFLGNGFKSCGADQCVYVKRSKNGFIYVCLYVDDMIIAAKTSEDIREVKDALKNAFKMKELGPAKFILGMEIDHDMTAGTLKIKQTRYIDDVVERFGQENAKPVDNPCAAGLKLSKTQSPGTDAEQNAMRSKPYRSLIGCLLYITTCTRPDIAFMATQLSRFLENPGQQHWNAAVRVLRYLKSARQHGIIYQGGTHSVTLKAYSDADWGTNLDDRRSVSGVMVMIGNAPVVFKSKFQRTVALSSAEAEYMALSLCVQEVLWTRAMLTDMGTLQRNATTIWEDNQGAIALAQNAGYHARTKHVDIRHHFIRENVERGTVKVELSEPRR